MDDPRLVRRMNRSGGPFDEPDGLVLGQRFVAGDQAGKRATLDELHGKVGQPLMHACLVDGADAGVVESPCGLGLVAECLEAKALVSGAGDEDLQRHAAAETPVLCQIDNRLAAAAQLVADTVRSDLLRVGDHG